MKNFNVIVNPKDVTPDETVANLEIATFNLAMFWRISVRSKNTMRWIHSTKNWVKIYVCGAERGSVWIQTTTCVQGNRQQCINSKLTRESNLKTNVQKTGCIQIKLLTSCWGFWGSNSLLHQHIFYQLLDLLFICEINLPQFEKNCKSGTPNSKS